MKHANAIRRFLSLAWPAMLLGAGCALAPPARPLNGRIEAPHAVPSFSGELLVAWGAVGEDGSADIAFLRGEETVRVNPVPGSAVAGRQVGPRLALIPPHRVLVTWVDRSRDATGDIALAASDDGGRSFGPPVRVNDDGGFAGQEYQDVAVLAGGRVAVTWLDERDAPPESRNQKQVYCALSADGGRTLGPSFAVTRSPLGVCPCCRPGVAASADGSLHVIYRDRSGTELFVRVATMRPGRAAFEPPVTVSRGGWEYPACPVDAPSLIALTSGELAAAWMDGSSGRPVLWLSLSRDGGKTFEPARPLDGSPAGGTLAFAALSPSCCEHPAGELDGARAVLAFHPRLGLAAVWEDTGGKIWFRSLSSADARARLVAGGEAVSAHSPLLVPDGYGFRVLWVETAYSEAKGKPVGRLEQARLNGFGGELSMAP